MFAVAGSKFDGTGFEKLQIVQTHVAVLAGGGSAGAALSGLSERGNGDAAPLLDGIDPIPCERDCKDDNFGGLGISVIFAEDFKNPA